MCEHRWCLCDLVICFRSCAVQGLPACMITRRAPDPEPPFGPCTDRTTVAGFANSQHKSSDSIALCLLCVGLHNATGCGHH